MSRATTTVGLCCLLSLACARTETRVYTVPALANAPATWTGRSVDDVVEAWGPPSARQSDGEGGTVLVYDEKTGISASATEGGPSPPDLDPSPRPGTTTTEEIKRPRAKFWIGADRKVYRFWFAADVYRKGGDSPPAKKPVSGDDEESAGDGD